MGTTLADLGRLILIILFLPLILILLGPLLVLAVIRGRQPFGPVTLHTARYSPAGRGGIMLLGLLLWAAIWSGLGWLILNAVPMLPVEAIARPPATATTAPPTATVPPATPTAALPSATPTPLPATFTPTPTVTPTESATAPTAPPTTPTPLPATATPTVSPTTGPSPTTTPPPRLTFAERQAVIATVKEANLLLRETIVLANEDNLDRMATIWQDTALTVAKRFASQIYEQYAQPMKVEFEYIQPPTIDRLISADRVVVTTQEKWAYGGPTKIDHEETLQFIYTLKREDELWIVTRYTYRNLPTPTPTP